MSMPGGQNKDQMHPQDLRNLIIFFIIASILYFAYDFYILRPQEAALRRQHAAQVEIQSQKPDYFKAHPEILAGRPAFGPPKPRSMILTALPRAGIDNSEIFGSIALKGGRIDDIGFHKYYEDIEKKNPVFLLSPPGTESPRYVEYGWVSPDTSLKLPDAETLWKAQDDQKLTRDHPVILSWENGQGVEFRLTYAIDDGNLITVTQKVINHSGRAVNVLPFGLISQTGLRPNFAPIWIAHEGPVGFMGSALEEASYFGLRKTPRQEFEASRGWAGITDKYWLTAMVPAQGAPVKYSYNYAGTPPKGREPDSGKYQVDYTAPPMTVAPGDEAQSESHLFAGAKKVMVLQAYGEQMGVPNFDLAIDFGWFWFMTKPFFYALHFLGEMTGNFGLAIILMTLVVRSAVFPLTNISYTSFAKMKKVTPQVLEIRKAYSEDKQKIQEELVKLYEKEKVHPMAGCLPMFVQIPIFFSLYKVLVTTIEMRHAPFFGWIQDLSAADPTNVFNLFGLIPWKPWEFLHVGVWPCILLMAFLIQRRLNPPPQDAISRDMNVYYPFLMCYMMSRFASGLVIYWALSAFIGITQQIIIMRRLGVPIYLFGETDAEAAIEQKVAEGQSVHPVLAMAEKEADQKIFGDQSAFKPVTPPTPRKKKKR